METLQGTINAAVEAAKQAHELEIQQSRIGGFGGSDAAIFAKIGARGLSALSQTDKRRILVAQGKAEPVRGYVSEAMQLGHDFEDWFAGSKYCPSEAEREVKIELNNGLPFKLFAHADFCERVHKTVWELKCLQEPNKALERYYAQLQWYYMLGASEVWLIVCDSNKGTFEHGLHYPIEVKRDETYIEILRNGIALLAEVWNEDFEISEELVVADLLPFDQEVVARLEENLSAIKILENQCDKFKQQLCGFMEANNVKSIKGESFNIVYVASSEKRTFDKSAFSKAHPEINLRDFDKISQTKAYVKINVKTVQQ